MSRKEFIENRLNIMSVNIDTEIQNIIQTHIIRTEQKNMLNKIYKQESFKNIEELKKNVL